MGKSTKTERLVFTIAALTELACTTDAKRSVVYDLKRPGLCLSITPAGTKSFYVYRKVDGRPRRYLLGTFPRMTIEQARDAADKYNGKVASGENPADERRNQREGRTLEEVFYLYLEKHAKPFNKRWRDEEKQFARYFGSSKEVESPDGGAVKKPRRLAHR